MIAEVYNIAGAKEEHLARSTEVMTATRKLDGCEGILFVGDLDSGEGVAVALWTDQAAKDAARAKVAADITEGKTMGMTITPSKVYNTVITL